MNSLLLDVSASQLRKAAILKEKIDKLQNQLGELLGAGPLESNRLSARMAGKTARRRRTMSPEAKAKIAAAARARWKKAKAAGKNRL